MTKTLAEVAEKMRDIDYAMLSSRAANGAIASRPMSNNREVEFDGDSFFFAYDNSRVVEDVVRDPQVGLSFQGKAGMLGMRPFFVAIEGTAELIRDRGAFERHWTAGLDRWFPDDIDTPGLMLIKVHAERLHYWDGEDEAEIPI